MLLLPYRDETLARQVPLATIALALACALAYFTLPAGAVAAGDLARSGALQQPWRFLTYAFLHGNLGHLLGNLLVLVLVGPFVEFVLGHVRFLLAYLAGAVAGGLAHLLVSDGAVIGASGAIAATVGMLAVLYGTRKVPVFYWVFVVFGTTRVPALLLLPVWALNEAAQWLFQAHGGPLLVAYGAHLGGLAAGALLARLLRPATLPWERSTAVRASTLATQAQEAAARLDIRRATRLYREWIEQEPPSLTTLVAYLNVAILGAEEEALRDAALRLLWGKFPSLSDEVRKAFVQLSQPKILKVLPIDEHLRLARRLVRVREDNLALRVIDDLLREEHLVELYGRQIVDCLLGLHTAYSRHGLVRQSEAIQSRLQRHFPSMDAIGGMAPTKAPPSTLFTSMRPTISDLSTKPTVGRRG